MSLRDTEPPNHRTTEPLKTLLPILASLVLAAEAARVCWYADDGRASDHAPVLTCTLPPELPRGSLDGSRAAEQLSYDSAEIVRIDGPGDDPWRLELTHLVFEAGNQRHLHDIYGHSPEACLPATGATLLRTLETKEVTIDGRTLRTRHLVFRDPLSGQSFNVFKCAWIAGMEEMGLTSDEPELRALRLQAVRARYRYPPAVLLLASVADAPTDQAAWDIFRTEVLERCRFRP